LPYLALAVTDDTELGTLTGRVPIETRIASAVQRDLGSRALLYRRSGDGRLDYFASARLAAISAPESGGRQCEVEALVWFEAPVSDDSEADNPAARRMLTLGVERFAQVLDHGGGTHAAGEALAEAGSLVFTRRLPEGFASILRDEISGRWGYRCAITRRQFDPDAADHPELRIVAIRPLEAGGPIGPANFLPMVESAERAWRRGAIAVAPNWELLGNFDLLDDELCEALRDSRKLLLPKRPDHLPNRTLLAWHRVNLFGRG
jgi:hypothetical protein